MPDFLRKLISWFRGETNESEKSLDETVEIEASSLSKFENPGAEKETFYGVTMAEAAGFTKKEK